MCLRRPCASHLEVTLRASNKNHKLGAPYLDVLRPLHGEARAARIAHVRRLSVIARFRDARIVYAARRAFARRRRVEHVAVQAAIRRRPVVAVRPDVLGPEHRLAAFGAPFGAKQCVRIGCHRAVYPTRRTRLSVLKGTDKVSGRLHAECMNWLFWLGLAVIVAAIAAVTGIQAKGTRPVAHTSMMGMARLALLALVIIVAFVVYRASFGG
jgi:hypothetical protein